MTAAAGYIVYGLVAQLVTRSHGMGETSGSRPDESIY